VLATHLTPLKVRNAKPSLIDPIITQTEFGVRIISKFFISQKEE
jgi:hypothetical protein